MNESLQMNAPADSFSMRRLGLMCLFYSSSIKKQLLIYFAVSMVFSALLLIPGPDGMRSGFFSLIWTSLQWMFFLAPLCMAAKGRSGNIERMLPVKASEALTFFIIYFLGVVPVILFALPIVTELYIYQNLGNENHVFREVLQFQLESSWIVKMINLFSGWCTAMACLFTILNCRHNRMLFGVLSAFAVEIALGIIGGIMGGYEAFRKGVEDGYCGREPAFDEMSTLEFTNTILQPSPATFVVTALIFCTTVIFIILIYRRLRYKKL